MILNGEPYAHREGLTIRALLDELRLDGRTVVVMHGEEIHRGAHAPDAPIAKDDVIEIVTMQQGG